jgi:hypothetical protein
LIRKDAQMETIGKVAGVVGGAAVACLVAALGGAGLPGEARAEATDGRSQSQATAEQTRVLYRVDLRIDAKRASPFERIQPVPFGNNVRVYLANLDRQDPVLPLPRLDALPGAAREDGWASIALAPGTYFLLVLPPGTDQDPPVVSYHAASARYGRLVNYTWQLGRGGAWNANAQVHVLRGAAPADFVPIGGFLLHVPESQPIVYAGTLRISCTSRGLLGDLIRECSDTSVSDETAAARSVAGALRAKDSDVHASLLSPYGSPTAPLDVRGTGLELLAVSPLKEGLGIDSSAPPVESPLVIGAPGTAMLVFNLFSIAGHSASVAASKQEAETRAAQWRPCIDRLAQEARSLDVMALASPAIASALAPLRAVAPPTAMRIDPWAAEELRIDYVLATRLDLQQLRLRECVARDTLCLELAMRVRFANLQSRESVLDAELVYANAWPPSDMTQTSHRLYQIPAAAPSECRPIETWCGENGVALLRQEVATGVEAIMGTAVRRAARR